LTPTTRSSRPGDLSGGQQQRVVRMGDGRILGETELAGGDARAALARLVALEA